mgnify:CR=1 FL=1
MLNYLIVSIIPMTILIILIVGLKERIDVFKYFIDGVMDGLKVVYNIFPYILSITIAIGLIKSTGTMDILIFPVKPILQKLGIPQEILPLCILRPLSGGASMSAVMDIFKTLGPDSKAGKMASIIMSANETTLYTITVFLGAIKLKKIRGVLLAGLIADAVATIISIILVNLGCI